MILNNIDYYFSREFTTLYPVSLVSLSEIAIRNILRLVECILILMETNLQ